MAKNLYETLGVSKDATMEEIKAAYSQLGRPFKPASTEPEESRNKFFAIKKAYDILSNAEKRSKYDEFGEDGLKDEIPAASEKQQSWCSEAFKLILDKAVACPIVPFGIDDPVYKKMVANSQYGNGMHSKAQEQNCPMEFDLPITLEEIDAGCTKDVKISQLVNGQAGQEQVVTIKIKPGCRSGTKLTLVNVNDDQPEQQSKDIVFWVREVEHPHFKCDGNDLKYTARIALPDALCGAQVIVPVLHGKGKTVSFDNEVITPNTVRRLEGCGLPDLDIPDKRGDLVVNFELLFPEKVNLSDKKTLYDILQLE